MTGHLTGSADLFASVWDAELPGGLAVARRSGLCINAILPAGGDALQAEEDETRARTLMLVQFTSTGTPCLSATALAGNPTLVKLSGLLAAVRSSYQDILAPRKLSTRTRLFEWHPANPGAVEARCLAYFTERLPELSLR